MSFLKNDTRYEYLKTLGHGNTNDIWFPDICPKMLDDAKKNNRRFVVAHDWYSYTVYEYYALTYFPKWGDELYKLQDIESCKIANLNGNFIFEEGSMDHKGLIAISIPVGTEFFIYMKNIDHDAEKIDIRLYFEPTANPDFKDIVKKDLGGKDVRMTVCEDQFLSITAEEYESTKNNLYLI